MKIFLYSSSVYSCHLFLISSASVRSTPFLSFIVPIFARNVPLVSLIFLKRSLVFPILLFSSISLHWSLRKAFLSLLAILWNSPFKWVVSWSLKNIKEALYSSTCIRIPCHCLKLMLCNWGRFTGGWDFILKISSLSLTFPSFTHCVTCLHLSLLRFLRSLKIKFLMFACKGIDTQP